ncbi:hypothetical protein [Streptomyces sp. NPDC056796]|uniref:hypothetical protein n=1 Tax=Streptomyces sp. NPDC056796 TaxID=3345947 RepID=UPI0036767325
MSQTLSPDNIAEATHFGCATCQDFYLIVGPLRTVVKMTEGGEELGMELGVDAALFFIDPECTGCLGPLAFGKDA